MVLNKFDLLLSHYNIYLFGWLVAIFASQNPKLA